MSGNKLRVGILTKTENLPTWALYIIEQLRTSDYADISLIIEESSSPRQGLTDKLVHTYLHLEGRQSQAGNNSSILDGVPRASSSDPNLFTHKLDLILHLGGQPAPPHLMQMARFGLLEISDGEQVFHADEFPGFFEVLFQKPITSCEILVTQEGVSRILQGGTIATDPISVARNREGFFWKAAFLMRKTVRKLHLEREAALEIAPETETVQNNGSRPNILDLMRLGFSQVSRFAVKKIRKKFIRDQWILMFAKNTDAITPGWDVFHPLTPPSDRFWADPFILEREGRYYVFFEELPYKTNLGRIACMILDADGKLLDNRPILEKPYHLSYPFLFEQDRTLFMIPETGQNRTIDLYRCTSFPFDWEYHKTLMDDIEAKDATLIEHDGKWWLFATIREHEGGATWDQLSVFWADNPLADTWTPHPLNPVVTDVRMARPAGNIFTQNGNLIRPSQDCSVRYGYALNFNRITKLNETEYEEVPETRLEPPPGQNILATHTFNKSRGLTIIDAVVRRKKINYELKCAKTA